MSERTDREEPAFTEGLEAAAKAIWDSRDDWLGAPPPFTGGRHADAPNTFDGETNATWQERGQCLRQARAAILAFLDAAEGKPVREAILATTNGAGEPLLRSDIKWTAPPASAGLIGAAVIKALRDQCLSQDVAGLDTKGTGQ